MENADQEKPVPWDMWTLLIALLIGYWIVPFLICNAIIWIHSFLYPSFHQVNHHPFSPAIYFLTQQSATVLAWGGVFWFLYRQYGPLDAYLGLVKKKHRKYFQLQETVKLLLLTTCLSFLMSRFWFWQHHGTQPPLPYEHYGVVQQRLLVLFALSVAPILEEVVFRGLIQSTFHKVTQDWGTKLSSWSSVVLTCLVFWLLHFNYFSNIEASAHVLLLGLCFSIWREKTQSILPGIVAHWFNNVLASITLLWC